MFIFVSILKLRCGLIKVNQTVGFMMCTSFLSVSCSLHS